MTNEEEEQQQASRPEVKELRAFLDQIVGYDIEGDLIRESDLWFWLQLR